MSSGRDDADALRREIEELRVLVTFRGALAVDPREPPPLVQGEVERLRWQRDDIAWRRRCLSKR
ncbi:hypothetical protein CDO52_13315 [Nocardiopsis gilva YIM 90087]|uniref:Uncharacterized protein n=1 Tax=Nocardiopsis gilva YIM 90087 TaxID=1235441 RepID=A0A223S6H9_9ACTN|nr:hypothetical protein [Nocardiopsis gilva]ASU83639.1 hypothetical protein CDO52_13315 [Nocardiopsis gilva YIM 90087]